jgi:hypothetical protein
MDQVRPSALRPARRSFLMPVMPYAAAAAPARRARSPSPTWAVGREVAPIERGRGATAGAAGPRHCSSQAHDSRRPRGAGLPRDLPHPPAALQNAALALYVKAHASAAPTVVLAVPSARFNEFRQRLRAIQERTRGDDTIRVILRPAR